MRPLEFNDDYGALSDPRYFPLTSEEYKKLTNEDTDGGGVDPDVPSSSASPAIMLKLKNGVTLPMTGHWDMDPDTGEYVFIRDREPIGVLTSDIAGKMYGMSIMRDPYTPDHYQVNYSTFNLPFSFDHHYSPGGEEGQYEEFIFVGVDVPGAIITVDTTYFEIVPLPEGFSPDFITTVTTE
jgi:hypothetical protein